METKKKKIGKFTKTAMKEAVELVMKGGSLRKVATLKNLSFQTLARYVKKAKEADNLQEVKMRPKYSVNKIFTETEEATLEQYIVKCSQMFYGLSTIDCLNLANETAVQNNKKNSC